MKVAVKKKDALRLFAELNTAVQKGDTTKPEAQRTLMRAEDEDGVFSKSWQNSYQGVGAGGAMQPTGGVPDVDWQNPNEARRAAKGSASKAHTQKVYEGLVEAPVGEVPFLMSDEDMRYQKRFQDLHDGMVFCVQHIKGYNPYASKYFPEYGFLAKHLVNKILTTQGGGSGSGTGGDFIPNTLSGQIISLFRQQLVLAGAFPHINLPESPFNMPLEGVDVDPYFIPEGTDELTGETSTDSIPTRTPTTGKLTFNAKAFKVRGLVSDEASEDSIINMVDYMRMKLVQSIAEGLEGVIINGDDSSTHQDSDITLATDYRKSMDGLRILSDSGTATRDNGGGAFTALEILNVFGAMGKFAANPNETLIIMSPIGLVHAVGDPNMLTVDQIGNRATLLNGQVGSLFGRPVLVSGKVREDLNNSGVHDGVTTDKTLVLVAHRPSWAIGDRRSVTVESAKDIVTGKFIIVVTWRGEFKRMQAETSSPQARNVGYVFNIDTTATFS